MPRGWDEVTAFGITHWQRGDVSIWPAKWGRRVRPLRGRPHFAVAKTWRVQRGLTVIGPRHGYLKLRDAVAAGEAALGVTAPAAENQLEQLAAEVAKLTR